MTTDITIEVAMIKDLRWRSTYYASMGNCTLKKFLIAFIMVKMFFTT